jgi:hypothetical protein
MLLIAASDGSGSAGTGNALAIFIFVWVIALLGFQVWAAVEIAGRKGRSAGTWALLAVLFGPFAVLTAGLVPPVDANQMPRFKSVVR